MEAIAERVACPRFYVIVAPVGMAYRTRGTRQTLRRFHASVRFGTLIPSGKKVRILLASSPRIPVLLGPVERCWVLLESNEIL